MLPNSWDFLARSIKRDINGTGKPMAAVNWMVTPHISKSIVKALTNTVAQNPHLHIISNPTTAMNPRIPTERTLYL